MGGSCTHFNVGPKSDSKFIQTLERVPESEGNSDPAKDKAAKVKEARLRCGGQLRQIMLAMHKYEEANGAFPLQAIAAEGKPLLSWRVALLPYLGEKELYDQFRLNESWDSEHNRKLLAKMPKIYKSAGKQPEVEYGTYFQVFVGKKCL